MAEKVKSALKQVGKATLYFRGEFFGNINKVEVREVETFRAAYAQYPAAPHAVFVPKGKRTKRGVVQGYKPSLVILEGWGHVDPATFLGEPEEDKVVGLTVTKSRYSACAPEWETEFNAALSAYLEANPQVVVVADYREAEAQVYA